MAAGKSARKRLRNAAAVLLSRRGWISIPVFTGTWIDIAGCSVDGDEGVAFAPLQRRQVFQVNVDEPDRRLLEAASGRLVRLGPLADAVALEAAMNGAPGELGVETAAHHLDDVVERQIELGAQFADQFLFQGGQGDAHPLRPVRAVLGAAALPPAIDGPIADAKLGNQFGGGGRAGLDVGPNLGRGGGVGVQIHAHDARRSMMKDTPRLTPIPLAQSSGTQHEGGGGHRFASRKCDQTKR